MGTKLNDSFGNTLRKVRLNRNLSQEKLAEICRIDRTYISTLERGLKNPSLEIIVKLSKGLSIKPSELIGLFELEHNI